MSGPVSGQVRVAPVVDPTEGRASRAGRSVFLLVGLNLAVQIGLAVVAVVTDLDVVTAVRLSLVTSLPFYAAGALWVLRRGASLGVRPRTGWETALVGAGEGFVVGAAAALLMVGVLRVLLGYPLLDPVAAVLAADGAVGPLLLGALVIVVVAPLVEELVFRGFLAEAFRPRGRWDAIVVSMIAFSLVHLRLAQLRYYMVLGLALALVYLRRGLIGSVCTHAAFNGVLLVAALSATHGPAVEATAAGASLTFPAAWSTSTGAGGADLVATGPAGSRVELAHADLPGAAQTPELVARALASGQLTLPDGVDAHPARVTTVDLPAGRAVSAEATVNDRDGRVVIVPRGGRLWLLIMRSEGSARDGSDFEAILRSWRLP